MSGRQSQVNGKQFENIFQIHCRSQGIFFHKIPVEARPIGRGKWIRKRGSFDYFLIHEGQAAAVDLKCYDKSRLCFSDLQNHQIMDLKGVKDHQGISGYIVWFHKENKIYFFEVDKLLELRHRESLGPEDGHFLGTIENLCLGNIFYIIVEGIDDGHLRDCEK